MIRVRGKPRLPWHDLLLDAEEALPGVGTAVVLAFTALEVFIADTLDELARHVIAVRAGWFHYNLEEGDEDFGAFHEWDGPGSLPRSADELVSGLEKTWQVMQEVLGRYTLADLQSTIQDEWEGKIYTYTRGWVIWHVIEHDIHHGGEIAYSLGMHGLTAPDI